MGNQKGIVGLLVVVLTISLFVMVNVPEQFREGSIYVAFGLLALIFYQGKRVLLQ